MNTSCPHQSSDTFSCESIRADWFGNNHSASYTIDFSAYTSRTHHLKEYQREKKSYLVGAIHD